VFKFYNDVRVNKFVDTFFFGPTTRGSPIKQIERFEFSITLSLKNNEMSFKVSDNTAHKNWRCSIQVFIPFSKTIKGD
jgi:hypothetical protein